MSPSCRPAFPFRRLVKSLPVGLALLALVPWTPCMAQGAVHVVDTAGGPGSDFTTIGAAVGAALDGDVILVRDGHYAEGVVLDGRALALQADPTPGGSGVSFEGLTVRNTGLAQHVSVRGFGIGPPALAFNHEALVCQFNQGPVWLEDLSIGPFATEAIRIEDSSSVLLSRVSVGITSSFVSNVRVDVLRSRVRLFDCELDASSASPWIEPTAAPAVSLREGELGIYGCSITGGRGVAFPGAHSCDDSPGPGGPAVWADALSTLELQDSTLAGGPGGGGGSCPVGNDGPAMAGSPALITQLTTLERTHRVDSPVRDDADVQVTLAGQPGDLVRVFFSTEPGTGLSHPALDVPLLVGRPWSRASLGTLDASGSLTLSVPLGDLGPGIEGVAIRAQAVFLGGGAIVASEPTTLVALDAAF